MEQYISVKAVQAEPCVRIDGKIVDHVDDKSHEYELGYRITYPDGYTSFCPKEIFERQYLEISYNPDLPTKAPSVSQEMVDNFVRSVQSRTIYAAGHPITVTTAVLVNGFTITKSSACVSVENYSPQIGEEINMEHIKNQIWNYLGFLMSSAVNGFRAGEPQQTEAAEHIVASSRR